MASFITILVVTIVFGSTLINVVALNETPKAADVSEENGNASSGPNVTDGSEGSCPSIHHVGLRYVIAKFNFSHVQTPFIVAAWILFVTLAKIGFHASKRLENLCPESCLLIVVGIVLGIITYFSSDQTAIIEFDTQLFFTVILPPIIMEAGYFIPTRAFFDQLGTILLHAIVATLVNTFLIGLSLWGFGQAGVFGDSVCLPLLHALVFASLLAAVDPVAVLAVFESIHVNQLLYIIVFGESLLNDGVAVVLYHMFSEFSDIGAENIVAADVLLAIVSFVVVIVGSLLIGTLMGLAGGFSARFTYHLRVMEPMVVVVIPYLAFLVAEMFHLSGILSCAFCGMTMRKYVEVNILPKSKTTIRYVMKMLASVAEAVIFMFLGVSAVSSAHVWNTEFVLLTVFFCLAFRAIVIVVLNHFANLVRVAKLDRISHFVMAYGGLRGAIAFSLAVVLDRQHFQSRQLFVTTTIVVVYFTNIVLGSTMQPLVKFLRVKTQQETETTMSETIVERVLDHVMVGIEGITKERGHHLIRERFLQLNHKYLRPFITGCKSMDKVHSPGAHILQVYKRLNEHDALTLSRAPTDPAELMRWNASLKNIASVLKNHTCAELPQLCTEASVAAPEVMETCSSENRRQCVFESPGRLLWSTLSPGDVFTTTDNPRVPRLLPTSSSAPQTLSVSSVKETRDLRRCVTSPLNNGVARKLADSSRRPARLDATRMLREDDAATRNRFHPGWSQRPASYSDAGPADNAHAAVFIKNQRVKFQLGHDDEPCDVITRDVIASI